MKNLLRAIAIAFAIGSAPAGAAADQADKPGASSPGARQQAGFAAAARLAPPYSFADILNFPFVPDPRAPAGVAMGYSPQGAEPTLIDDLPLVPNSGVDGAGWKPGAIPSSNGSQIDLSRAFVPDAFAARASGAAGRNQGDEYLVPVAAAPEPSGGEMLLCGLTVLAFMARRKIQPVAG